MNLLRKELAPITDAAWEEIEDQARRFFNPLLSARKFVDVDGPHGVAFGAVSTGRLVVPPSQSKDGVEFGVNQVQPLLEVRVPFTLNIWELDNTERGAKDADLAPMEDAARKIAKFEEDAVYRGFEHSSIRGLEEDPEHQTIPYNGDINQFLASVSKGITSLRDAMVEGPYTLVVSPAIWSELSSCVEGRPLKHHLEYVIDGPVVTGPFVEKSFLVSTRGGDLELILGQDISIGYKGHDADNVHLYFTESFTFRIYDPAVVVFFA
jgi:uncharacterized linocin/CFP29 family protein